MIFSNLCKGRAYKNTKYLKLIIRSNSVKIIDESEISSLNYLNTMSQAVSVEIDFIKKKGKWLIR